MDTKTVYVVDDDAGVRAGLQYLIESVALKVHSFASLIEFIDHYRPGGVGCLVLDVRMPGMSGMEFLERRDAMGIDMPVIMLSGHGTIPMATRALREGAIDFVQKPINEQLLLDRIHEAVTLSEQRQATKSALNRFSTLSPREREVVEQIARGLHNKEVARVLGLSPRTVEAHRAQAMKKLGVHASADLIATFLRFGALLRTEH